MKRTTTRLRVLAAACFAVGLGGTALVGAPDAMAITLQSAPAATTIATTEAATTTSPAGVEQLQATVTKVQGYVQVRDSADEPWRPATVDMVVGQNAEFRTGVRSAVQFVIPQDHTITLDRLGTVKVLTAVRAGDKITTELGMKYGRTRYDIEPAGLEHDSRIVSPSNTLLVRGTRFSAFDQRPFPAEAVSLTGRVEVRDAKKRIFVGSRGGSKAKVNTAVESAATYALFQSVVDPTVSRARTANEQKLVNAVLSTGAVESFDFEKGIRVITGGKPLTDQQLIPVLPGTLNFVLRWTGNADLNLGVINAQLGQTVYPIGGRDRVPSGGGTPFDHRGGPNGGIEVVSWAPSAPAGTYFIGVQKITGVDTPATVDVFRAPSGQRVDIGRTAENPTGNVKTAHFTATDIPVEIAAGIFVGDVQLSAPLTRAQAAAALQQQKLRSTGGTAVATSKVATVTGASARNAGAAVRAPKR
jgi:hypothetical protein